MLSSIDHVILPARDLDEAAAPSERLGVTLSPRMSHGSGGTANRAFFVGSESNHFYVELLAVVDEATARASPGRESILRALEREPALDRVMLGTDDVAGLGSAAEGPPREAFREDGSKVCDVQDLAEVGGLRASAVQYTISGPERYAARKSRGMFESAFALKRIDHLTAMAPDLDATTSYWVDSLGVPVFGEISNDVLTIRQMKVGDAILELLGPTSPDSPLASRPPGLSSMVAFEVADPGRLGRHGTGAWI